MVAAIACVDFNYGIGYQNKLLISIPEDLKRFKELTKYSCVIMGRKTWESLPKKPLKNRLNLVITNNPLQYNQEYVGVPDVIFVDMEYVKRLLEVKNCNLNGYTNFWIIGGESIYKELLPYCDRIELTLVSHCFGKVDAHFPAIYESEWDKISCSERMYYDEYDYRYITYERKKQNKEGDSMNSTPVYTKPTPRRNVSIESAEEVVAAIQGQGTVDATEGQVKQFDDVECPKHYTDGNIEVIDFIEDKKLGFCLGNVVKYVARAGKKHSADKSDKEKEIQDLNKARWYLDRRIKELKENIVD